MPANKFECEDKDNACRTIVVHSEDNPLNSKTKESFSLSCPTSIGSQLTVHVSFGCVRVLWLFASVSSIWLLWVHQLCKTPIALPSQPPTTTAHFEAVLMCAERRRLVRISHGWVYPSVPVLLLRLYYLPSTWYLLTSLSFSQSTNTCGFTVSGLISQKQLKHKTKLN